MQGAWLTPEAVPSERERDGHNGECKAELDCLRGDEETDLELRVLVTVGGPENWKDKIAGGLQGIVPVLCTTNQLAKQLDSEHFAGWRSICSAAKEPQERIQILVERWRGDIADGQLRRQPRRQNDRVPEPMNEMRGDQKKERESVARGTSRWGWERATECERGEGLAFRPLPEQQSEIKSWKSSHKNSSETSSIEIESSRRNQQIVRTVTSETNEIVLTDMEVLTVKVLKYIDELPESAPVGAKEMPHLGCRNEVNQTLSRLVRRGELMEAGRGVYLLAREK